MDTAKLPEVNWCKLYGMLAEAVDHAGYEIRVREDGQLIDLIPKTESSNG